MPRLIRMLAGVSILNQVTILETIVAYNMLQYVTRMLRVCSDSATQVDSSHPFAKCRNRNLAPSNKLSKRTLLPMSEYHLRLTSFCNIATTFRVQGQQTYQPKPIRGWVSERELV